MSWENPILFSALIRAVQDSFLCHCYSVGHLYKNWKCPRRNEICDFVPKTDFFCWEKWSQTRLNGRFLGAAECWFLIDMGLNRHGERVRIQIVLWRKTGFCRIFPKPKITFFEVFWCAHLMLWVHQAEVTLLRPDTLLCTVGESVKSTPQITEQHI